MDEVWRRNLKGKRAVVIGGGVAGMAAAASLSLRGAKTTLLERGPGIGGRMAPVARDGHVFEPVPGAIILPLVFTRLWAHADLRFSDFVQLEREELLLRVVFPDRGVLDLPAHPQQLREEISRLESVDGDRALPFTLSCERARVALERDILRPNRKGFAPPPRGLAALLKAPFAPTIESVLRRRFRDERVRRGIHLLATGHLGISPLEAPASLLGVLGIKWKHGQWIPEGGMGALLDAFARLLDLTGVLVATNTSVERIEVSEGHVRGVAGTGFSGLGADIVVSAVSGGETLLSLLDGVKEAEPLRRQWLATDPAPSALELRVELPERAPILRPQMAFPGRLALLEERRQIDRWKVPAAFTTLMTSLGTAPGGGAALTIHAPMPAITPRWRWTPDRIAAEANRILADLWPLLYPERKDDTAPNMEVTGPPAFADRWRLSKGSLVGAVRGRGDTASGALPHRIQGIRGLYLAGASTYPLLALDGAVLSGIHAAELAAEMEG
jgi:phytoene dehydrogenase-like protein